LFELKDWIEKTKFPEKPWLVLGKGPTFSQRDKINLANYNSLALNHVVREQKVDVAHIIDIDVLELCAEALLTNCNWLIMPRCPHVNCYASAYMTLNDWIQCIPVLAEIEKQGKLVTYSFAHEPKADDPWTIDARFFSSEIALGILGRMGVKTVRSLGIDGGRNYSNTFSDLQELINNQPSFDLQFERLEELAARYNLDYLPLIKASDQDLMLASASNSKVQQPDRLSSTKELPLSAKIQKLECDLRETKQELKDTNELLYFITKELSVCSERLGWSENEVQEYRERVLELERQIHLLHKSVTWKIGRLVTKPILSITKQIR